MAATLKVDTITNASNAGTANLTLDASGNATVGNTLVMGSSFKRNRIINGDMRVDQRNAGASISAIASAAFVTDRWAYYTNATAGAFNAGQNLNSVTLPTGFTKYLGFQVASTQTPTGSNAYFMGHKIEGFNVADLAWGTASAKTITLSFWVYTSVTGTHSGNVQNASNNRSYVFSYSVSALEVNTWKYVTVTIPGDTTGTWATDNTAGLIVYYNLGAGSSISTTAGSWNAAQYIGVTGGVSVVSNASATFYITGVQLEVGSVATPYERQIYSEQLAQCQRYLPAFNSASTVFGIGPGYTGSTTSAVINCPYVVTPRVSPTGITVSNASHITFTSSAGSFVFSAASFGSASSTAIGFISGTISGATAGQGGAAYFNSTSGQLLFTGCEL